MYELIFSKESETPLFRYLLTSERFVLGQGDKTDVNLVGEGIDPEHAVIHQENGCFLLENLSPNGLKLNGEPIRKAPLKPGDRIGLKAWTITFSEKEDDAKEDLPKKSKDTVILEFNQKTKEIKVSKLKLKISPPQGKNWETILPQSVIRIGKDPDNTLKLEDPAVSKSHCVIFFRDGVYYIRDTDSSNGTILNGNRIHEAVLKPRDKLLLGETSVECFPTTHNESLEAYEGTSFQGMVGKSIAMRRIFTLIQKVAPTESVVCITGESGTGKELVARAIHNLSPRKDFPFVALNSTAIHDNLRESELFGHEKGAFTGADERHAGAIEQANRGTLFLDELGDMPLNLQATLLRFLENKTYRRVGGTKEEKADVRVVVATNRNLKKAVEEGRFREDLYYRLQVIPIALPSLRERPEDIELLTRHFLTKLSATHEPPVLDKGTLKKLQKCHWFGNVRELKNVLERSLVLATHKGAILPSDINFVDAPARNPLDDEKSVVQDALSRTGSIRKAARLIGVHRSYIERRVKKFKIN